MCDKSAPVGEERTEYKPMDNSEVEEQLGRFYDLLKFFFSTKEFEYLDWMDGNWQVKLDHYALIDIIIRVDKRRKYYSYFHRLIEIDERKEAGLMAYWVIKFHPISLFHTGKSSEVSEKQLWLASLVNEAFAAFLICSAILKYFEKTTGSSLLDRCNWNATLGSDHSLSESYKQSPLNRLIYSFRYSNISIDSMVTLVDVITPEFFCSAVKSE